MPEIQDMTYRHEAILRWLVCNPHRPLKDCARELGYTQAWLSIIVHSDIFQARLRHMQDNLNDGALVDIRQKLQGIAHAALDKMADSIEFTDDPKMLLDVADKALNRLGYGSKGPSLQVNNYNQTNNIGTVPRSVLEEARALRQGLQSSISHETAKVIEDMQATVDAEELRAFPLDPEMSGAEVLLSAETVRPVTEKTETSLAALLYGEGK